MVFIGRGRNNQKKGKVLRRTSHGSELPTGISADESRAHGKGEGGRRKESAWGIDIKSVIASQGNTAIRRHPFKWVSEREWVKRQNAILVAPKKRVAKGEAFNDMAGGRTLAKSRKQRKEDPWGGTPAGS